MKTLKGDCLEILKILPAESCDSLVTDPPAGISFMGKGWDGDKGGRAQWVAWMTEVMTEALRVLKPGAHALVWAIPRTSHWTMSALEDAGFEIRDVVTHLFGTGFPKSLDVSKAIDKEAGAKREVVGTIKKSVGDHCYDNGAKMGRFGSKAGVYSPAEIPVTRAATDAARQWQGFGTALKPACEFWILCRKPISEKTVAKNVLQWGTGALNIDGCRIGTETITTHGSGDKLARMKTGESAGVGEYREHTGRFPANLVLDEEAAEALDEQAGHLHGAGNKRDKLKPSPGGFGGQITGTKNPNYHNDKGGYASRFFYVAKASKSDRGEGNTHPTVKSTKLMSYLVRLVTPPGGTVLDPFMGSGSTGVAAQAEGMQFIGIEQDDTYFDIATSRLKKAE